MKQSSQYHLMIIIFMSFFKFGLFFPEIIIFYLEFKCKVNCLEVLEEIPQVPQNCRQQALTTKGPTVQ